MRYDIPSSSPLSSMEENRELHRKVDVDGLDDHAHIIWRVIDLFHTAIVNTTRKREKGMGVVWMK